MEQGRGLQDTKRAGYILIVNGQSTVWYQIGKMKHNLYWVQSNELLLGYSGEESGRVTYLLIQESEGLPCMVLTYVFK